MPDYKNLFLRQSYLDSYADYARSLKSTNQPRWDFCILTASNKMQAEAFKQQIDYRIENNFLPKDTHFAVIPDPDGKRVGSGGATLNAMKYVKDFTGLDSFKNLKILVIHSGGDSKRVPQYSACGKLFSPVPRELPDGRRSTLFDEMIIATTGIPSRISDGMLVCSGDVLLLFNPLQIDFYSKGAAVISVKENVNTGKDHGVFLKDDNGNVGSFLHKQSVEKLKSVGAVNAQGKVNIDTGAVIFDGNLLDSLYTIADTDEKFRECVNEHVRLSFYADFLYPLASNSTLEQFYKEIPEGDFSQELKECRTKIWNAINGYSMKLMCFSPASFIHFGTTWELLQLVTKEIESYKFIDWSRCVNTNNISEKYSVSNSYIYRNAQIGEGSYIEDSYIKEDTVIGENCVISGVTLKNVAVPDGTVLHGLKLADGRFIVRMYGVNDNPKNNFWFGEEIECPLWNKKLFPVKNSISEAVRSTLNHENDGELLSLSESFNMADVKEILPWRNNLSDVVTVEKYLNAINKRMYVKEANKIFKNGISRKATKLLLKKAEKAKFDLKMRIYYYLSKLCTGAESEEYENLCFKTIESVIYNVSRESLIYDSGRKIKKDHVITRLPVRVNWGGGWSDTPPYCNEHGGTVLNAAILLDDGFPIEIELKKLDENKVVFASADYGSYSEFTDIDVLRDCNNPHDPFALHKAALIASGIIPMNGEISLSDVLSNLGGGIYLSTQVINIPRGSGLGTSSILAGACIKGLFEFLGEDIPDNELYGHVLCMEQLMSTGGGWQDQVGGLCSGIKVVTAKAGIVQNIECERLELTEEIVEELQERFCIIYTGQRRLARNLLREVIGKYIGSNPETLQVLRTIQNLAWQMKRELENGNIDAFASSLSEHWELSKALDSGSTNTCIDQIFLACDDMIDGKMISGAGGGGFLQVVLKKSVSKDDLRERLQSVFADTGVDIWNCRFYM